MSYRYSNARRDPREIIARFDSQCAETDRVIRKDETCVYYPMSRKAYHIDSKQAEAFREWQADLAMGYDY